MKQSWDKKTLKEVAPAKAAKFPADNETVWNLSLEEIESGTGKILREVSAKVSELGSSKTSFDENNVLYSKLRPYLNKVVVPEKCGVGTSELIPLFPNTEILDREFLAFYLRSPEFLEFAKMNTQGTNLPRVSMNSFWNHEIGFPIIEEQQRIVGRIKECLSRVDEIKQLREKSRKEAEAIFPSVLSSVFDDLKDVEFVSIEDVVLETRYGTSQKCNTQLNGIPILRIPNVGIGTMNFENLKHCNTLTENEISNLLLKNGDILVVRTNGSPNLVGRCAVFENEGEDFGYASYLIRFRVDKEKVNPKFLSFFLTSSQGRKEISKIRRSSAGQYNVNGENLKAIKFPLPDLESQTSLVEKMESQKIVCEQLLDEQIGLSQESLNLTQSILSKAFAGEL